MTVSQLQQELAKMPADAEVWHIWDGGARTYISEVIRFINDVPENRCIVLDVGRC